MSEGWPGVSAEMEVEPPLLARAERWALLVLQLSALAFWRRYMTAREQRPPDKQTPRPCGQKYQGDDADYDHDHEEGLWLSMQPVCLCRRTPFMISSLHVHVIWVVMLIML